MIKILFVCLGNICRSTMAEAVFRHKVSIMGLQNKIMVDSAGTGSWHIGEPPHQGTRKLLDEKSISYEGILARKISKEDFTTFNYIIAMDESNYLQISDLYTSVHNGSQKPFIGLLSSFIPNTTWVSVPDPWYTKRFDKTFELIDQGCDMLLKHICLLIE